MASMTAPHVEAASTLAVIASSNEPSAVPRGRSHGHRGERIVLPRLSNRPGERSRSTAFRISAQANGPCRNSARC